MESWRGYLNEQCDIRGEYVQPDVEGWEKVRTDFLEYLFSTPSVHSEPYTVEHFANFPDKDWRGTDEIWEGGKIKNAFTAFVGGLTIPEMKSYGEFGELIATMGWRSVGPEYFPCVVMYVRKFGKNLQNLDDETVGKLITLFEKGDDTMKQAFELAETLAE